MSLHSLRIDLPAEFGPDGMAEWVVHRFGKSEDSDLTVESNQSLKNVYVSLSSQAFSSIRIGKRLVDSLSG